MKVKVKDFTITPVLCPAGMKDCSPCKHARSMKVRNPPAMGTAPADFGEVSCNYLDWYEEEYRRKCKEV